MTFKQIVGRLYEVTVGRRETDETGSETGNEGVSDALAMWMIILGGIMIVFSWCISCCYGTWKKRGVELCLCNSVGAILVAVGIYELN